MASQPVVHRAVARFALLSRIFIVVLQFVSNTLIPDHEPDVFNPPLTSARSFTFVDKLIFLLFGGFRRWDAIYFLHIAEHGYTYENCIAFFPLYPLLVSLAKLISVVCPAVSVPAAMLVFGVTLNVALFVISAVLLLQLGHLLLKDEQLAYRASLLFCINPASIFMTAPYTETLFAVLSFGGMLCLTCEKLPLATLLFGISGLTRSNGLVSMGFIFHNIAVQYIAAVGMLWRSIVDKSILCYRLFKETVSYAFLTVFLIVLGVLPFALYQYYIYRLFCFPEKREGVEAVMFSWLADYGRQQGFNLQGEGPVSPWCHSYLPLSYSYIQAQHWGVGFMRYYQLKQIPRFIMAAPAFLLSMLACWNFYRIHPEVCNVLGLIETGKDKVKGNGKDNRHKYYDSRKFGWTRETLVVYMFHLLFLCLFGALFIHIEVLTRFLCSSSPVIYWFAAHLVQPPPIKFTKPSHTSRREPMGELPSPSTWLITLLKDYKQLGLEAKLVVGYFMVYFVVGTVAFSNFLPWT